MHRNTILIHIQQDAMLHSLFYLETSLHVSDDTTTHHQERKQLYLQHLVFVTPLLLSAAIVEELELVLSVHNIPKPVPTFLFIVVQLELGRGTKHSPNFCNFCRIILIYIQQDATLHSLFYLETSLQVSGDTTTHHQERKQLYLQHLVFVTPLLLSATIVEELELV